MAAGCGLNQHTSTADPTQTLALSGSLSTIPVYLPSEQETALDAATNPIVAIRYQNAAFLRQLGLAYGHVPVPKRPIIILITDPDTTSVQKAIQRVGQVMAQAHVTLPWSLQIGPDNLYAGAQPTLLTVTPQGQSHRVIGPKLVLNAVRHVAALPKLPVVHGHRSPQSKKNNPKG